MKHKLLLLTFLFLINNHLSAHDNQEIHFAHLGVENGLSQLSVLSIFQDSEGYLWFGTRNGANRYDGYSFTVYQNEVNDESTLSDSYIRAFAEDEEGNIWIATSSGVNVIDHRTKAITRLYPRNVNPDCPGNVVMSFLKLADGSLFMSSSRYLFRCNSDKTIEAINSEDPLPSVIYSMAQDASGDIYLGTERDGLFIYSSGWTYKTHYQPEAENGLPLGTILTILPDNSGKVWLGLEDSGICVYDKERSFFQCFNQSNSGLTHNSVRSLIHYDNQYICAGTFGGIHFIDKVSMLIKPVSKDLSADRGLSHYSIHSLLLDRNQTLWIGTYSAGINYYSPFANYNAYINCDDYTGITGKGQEANDGNMWFATEGSGLLCYNPATGARTLYPIEKIQQGNYMNNIIKSILIQGDTILCATHYGSVYKFSIRTKTYTLLYDYKLNDIFSLYTDSGNRLWIPTNSDMGLVLIDKGKQTNIFEVNGSTRTFTGITHLLEIAPRKFLIGSYNDSLYVYNENEKTCSNLSALLTGNNPYVRLGSITGLLKDSIGNIWISTTKNGLFRMDPTFENLKHYQKLDGVSRSQVNSLTIDSLQQVWITTGSSIHKLDRNTDQFMEIRISNIPANEYTWHSGNSLSGSGLVYFPGDKGILGINSSKSVVNPHPPRLHITSLLINNKLEKLPDVMHGKIELTSAENNIIISFAALNYVHPENNLYTFKLEGIDSEWHFPGYRREVFYTNLAPGTYTFRVRASNNDEIWTDRDTTLLLIINPPFYRTWWAYTLYIIITLLIFFLLFRAAHKKQEKKREERYKEMEQKKERELHEERIRMFTNFSHELRTPLTLIMNPLNDLIRHTTFSPDVKKVLQLMKKNTGRMLLLVNNLMDIRKYETGKCTLEKTRFDFCAFVAEVYSSFESMAVNRNIQFQLQNELPEIYTVMFDQQEIEKVFFNLLSNAFKFTPANGMVTIRLMRVNTEEAEAIGLLPEEVMLQLTASNYILIEIADSGIGFDTQDKEKIFESFYSGTEDVHKELSGTGIGLSLSRAIIKQHGGAVWATGSKGHGAHFYIVLPDQEIQSDTTSSLSFDIKPTEIHRKVNLLVEETERKEKQTLLLADDNEEVLEYLYDQLSKEYQIYQATNGRQVLELLQTVIPDLIISDVMMPEVNGLSLCKQLKSDEAYSHIPFILLTGKSMVSQIEEGLEAGADDYIVKPFHTSLLKTRIRNLLISRKKMQVVPEDVIQLKQLGLDLESKEDGFIKEYIEIIKANISNPEFDIALIYETLGISRANFYRKVKLSTGLSPVDLIKNIRLEASLKLLKETNLNVSEIAQQVGFSSRSYFARMFKATYGISPTDYQKNNELLKK